MDGTWEHMLSEFSETEIQILHGIIYMWNMLKKSQTHRNGKVVAGG